MAQSDSYTLLDISAPSTSSQAVFNNANNFHALLEDLQFTPEKSYHGYSETDVEVIYDEQDEREDTDVKYPYQRKNKYADLFERLDGRLKDGSMELSKDLEKKVNEAYEVINKSDVFNGTRFDKSNLFTCLFCSKFFKCTASLNEHIAQAHNSAKNKHQCSKCGNSYKHKKNLVSHMEKHALKQEYECKVCNMVFRTLLTLEAHSAREHSESNKTVNASSLVTCKLCKKDFAESALKRHSYYCENKAEILAKRAEKKSVSVPPSPAMPAASIASYTNLKSLTPVVSYVDKTCKVCGQAFASRQSMLRHIGRKHPELKDDASVTAVTYVSMESPMHQYACVECGKRLTTRAALTLHKQRAHSMSNRFSCKLCSKSYPIPSELRKHMKNVHEKNGTSFDSIAEENDLTTF